MKTSDKNDRLFVDIPEDKEREMRRLLVTHFTDKDLRLGTGYRENKGVPTLTIHDPSVSIKDVRRVMFPYLRNGHLRSVLYQIGSTAGAKNDAAARAFARIRERILQGFKQVCEELERQEQESDNPWAFWAPEVYLQPIDTEGEVILSYSHGKFYLLLSSGHEVTVPAASQETEDAGIDFSPRHTLGSIINALKKLL